MHRPMANLIGLTITLAFGPSLATPVQNIAVAPAQTAPAVGGLEYQNDSSRLKLKLDLQATGGRTDGFAIDKDDTQYEPSPYLFSRARVGLDYRFTFAQFIWLDAEYEHDLYTGLVRGSTDQNLESDPNTAESTEEIRKAKLGLRLGLVKIGGGISTSHWGLGLLANDGAHGWTPTNALFADPRRGDRVLRGYTMIGPFTPAKLALSLAYDSVLSDDVLVGDDDAKQFVGALVVNPKAARTGGVYVARRTQDNGESGETQVTAIDVYGKWTQELGAQTTPLTLTVETEIATVIGTTDLGPNPDFPEHDVTQLGALTRISLARKHWGTVLDVLYASGDQNLDDQAVNNFKADRNVFMGQILFPTMLTAISARAPITASNPELVGVPAQDLDRVPTRGAITNTISIFPRAWFRFDDSVTLYGGPVIAFSNVALVDPLNTKTSGGEPHNAFDASPGGYLGTELNIGLRYMPVLFGGKALLGIEAAHLTPGEAFIDSEGRRPDAVSGGRLFLGYSI